MRVIAGKFRSRNLRSLPGTAIRPTADRLRETLFNVLTAGNPPVLEAATWIDLFAGTGAVGIEALSRGAAQVYFVESSAPAASLVRQNLKTLGIDSGFEVMEQDVFRAIPKLQAKSVAADFIYLDPPYRMEAVYLKTLKVLAQSGLLHADGRVIAEHQKKFDPGDEFEKLQRYRTLVQGDGALSFYKMAG